MWAVQRDEAVDPRDKIKIPQRRGKPRRLMLLAMRTTRRSMATLVTLVAWVSLAALAYFIVAPYNEEGVMGLNMEGVKEHYILLTALIAATMALLQLRLQETTRRGQFVSEYLTKFYLDDALWRTYDELIYRYPAAMFDVVDKKAVDDGKIAEAIEAIKDKDKRHLGGDQTNASCANHRYHPWLFQFTDEERRLDALFGYLRVIDYYCAKGLISTREVYRQLGTFLLTIAGRKVVEEYIKVNDFAWSTRKYRGQMGVDSPMRGVKNLLDCVMAYDWLMRVKRVPSVWHDGGENEQAQ